MQSPLNKPNLMQIGIFPICKELQRNESAFAESRHAANDLKKSQIGSDEFIFFSFRYLHINSIHTI